MKKLNQILLATIIVAIAFTSCKKSKQVTPTPDPLPPNYPTGLTRIITAAIIDSLVKDGMKLNPGLTPAIVTGIYLLSPDSCIFDNSSNNSAGSIYDDYLFKFGNQNNSTNTIDFIYKDTDGGDSGAASNASIISGGGTAFTIFSQATDTTSNVVSVFLSILSGDIVPGGIKNMQFAFYEKSKGPDPNGDVAPVGTIRIFDEEDALAVSETTYAIRLKQIQKRASKMRSVLWAVKH